MVNIIALVLLFVFNLFYITMSIIINYSSNKLVNFLFRLSQVTWYLYAMSFFTINYEIIFDLYFYIILFLWISLIIIFEIMVIKILESTIVRLDSNFSSNIEIFCNKLEFLHNGVFANKFSSSKSLKESSAYSLLTFIKSDILSKFNDLYEYRNKLNNQEITLLNVFSLHGSDAIENLMSELMFEEDSDKAVSEFTDFVNTIVAVDIMHANLMHYRLGLGGDSLCLLSIKES